MTLPSSSENRGAARRLAALFFLEFRARSNHSDPSSEGGSMAHRVMAAALAVLGLTLLGGFSGSTEAWEPTKPIEFVVAAGTGGGADQMARLIAPLVDKYKLSPRPLVVVNKAGGAGAEALTYVKGKSGDTHTILITTSNLFTTPLHTGVPFNWKDLTPVARLALDEFILWVNSDRPDKKDFKTAKEYLAAVKEAFSSRPSASSSSTCRSRAAARSVSISWATTSTRR
jgi:putative tricarboxylic transport membrane protein